jgi:xylan 1,4-beta-xylosidase
LAGVSAAAKFCLPAFAQALPSGSGSGNEVSVEVDIGKTTGDFPHYWEQCAGSDRAVIGLREQWRKDLMRTNRDCGMKSVRFHGLFDDEMGVATRGIGSLNFLYVDQVYDFMLENGVRPFVELSFMPEAFATSPNRIFSYRGNVSPPSSWKDWHDLVQAYTAHCVKRYGAAEVAQWKFEVWNEPNIGFWAGSQEQYFELYRQSVLAVKSVDRRIAVGGPATAMLAWIPDFIRYCASKSLPVDFVSTHIYPSDPQVEIFGRDGMYPFEQVIPKGLAQAKSQIESSAMPHLPLWITEWSSQNPAFIADTIRNGVGLAESMSYWTFSNVFEELGVPNTVFNDTFGLLNQYGIPRLSFHAMSLLHKLGEKQVKTGDGSVIATTRPDGSAAVLLWNLVPESTSSAFANGNPADSGGGVSGSHGAPVDYNLKFAGLDGRRQIRITLVDDKTGSAIPAWEAMGKPASPSQEQIARLHVAAELPQPKRKLASSGNPEQFRVTLPPNGIALLEIER